MKSVKNIKLRFSLRLPVCGMPRGAEWLSSLDISIGHLPRPGDILFHNRGALQRYCTTYRPLHSYCSSGIHVRTWFSLGFSDECRCCTYSSQIENLQPCRGDNSLNARCYTMRDLLQHGCWKEPSSWPFHRNVDTAVIRNRGDVHIFLSNASTTKFYQPKSFVRKYQKPTPNQFTASLT